MTHIGIWHTGMCSHASYIGIWHTGRYISMSHASYRNMTHRNDTQECVCVARLLCLPYSIRHGNGWGTWVMSHVHMWMDESCLICLHETWLMWHEWTSHVSYVYMRHDSYNMPDVHACAFSTSAASRLQVHVINIDESRLIHRWVMSHVHTCAFYTSAASRIQLNVTYIDESCLM